MMKNNGLALCCFTFNDRDGPTAPNNLASAIASENVDLKTEGADSTCAQSMEPTPSQEDTETHTDFIGTQGDETEVELRKPRNYDRTIKTGGEDKDGDRDQGQAKKFNEGTEQECVKQANEESQKIKASVNAVEEVDTTAEKKINATADLTVGLELNMSETLQGKTEPLFSQSLKSGEPTVGELSKRHDFSKPFTGPGIFTADSKRSTNAEDKGDSSEEDADNKEEELLRNPQWKTGKQRKPHPLDHRRQLIRKLFGSDTDSCLILSKNPVNFFIRDFDTDITETQFDILISIC